MKGQIFFGKYQVLQIIIYIQAFNILIRTMSFLLSTPTSILTSELIIV